MPWVGRRKFDFPVERALFAMVANRACAPSSKWYGLEQWLQEEVHLSGTESLEWQPRYRAMDFLEAHQEAIEEAIYFRLADRFNLDVDLVFYDTTSLHFEIDEEDRGAGENDRVRGSIPAGAKSYPAPRKPGKSKNGREDAPQIVIGLAVTRDGFPVRHWVFAGNTVEVTMVKRIKTDLRGWQLSRCVFVGDAGMVSEENRNGLSRGGGKYIVCMPIHRGGEVAKVVLTRPGRYREVTDNLQVKEVVVGDGERRRRYVVGHNPQEEKRQRQHREPVLKELEAELSTLREGVGEGHSKRVCTLRASGRYGNYICLTKTGKPVIDQARVREQKRLDGKFVVHSNDDTLQAEDLALGYKPTATGGGSLAHIEKWITPAAGLSLCPPSHPCLPVFLTVLALFLERIAEQACADTWRTIRDDLKTIKLAQLLSPKGTVWQLTEPSPDATKRLKSLRIKKPPPILHLS